MRRFCQILLGASVAGAVACGGGGGDGGPPTITSVVISGDSTVVLAGTRSLSAVAMSGGSQVTGVTFQWFSSDTTRATVSPGGVVSGVRLGTASITAEAVIGGAPTGVTSSAHGVRTRIGAIVFTPATPTFASFHDTVVVTADARDALNASIPGVTFTWQSRNSAVATAADSGTHRAIVASQTNGTARIVATGDGVADSVTATVQQVATTLSITPDTTTFDRIGATVTPTVTAADARGNAMTAAALGWSSLNAAAATVNATSGVITSVNEGQTRVVGTSGSLTDTIRVGVFLTYNSIEIATSGALPAPINDSVVINRKNGTFQLGAIVRDAGNTVVPSPQGVAWSLKSGTIAAVGASSGLLTGNDNTGRDTIVVAARGVRDSVPFVVRQVLATIVVTPASPQPLNFVSDTQRFAAEPRDSGGAAIPGQTITWSTNNAVLGISSAGLATAVQRTSAAGVTVKVRAATGGMTDSSKSIVVRQVPRFADLDPNTFDNLTAIGRSVSASCVVRDSASDTIPNHACTWTAGTAGVVTFSPAIAKTTTITAAGNGSTTINAQAATSLFGVNSVTVDQVPATLTIVPANLGTPNVQMRTSQNAPFWVVIRDSLNHIDGRSYTVNWSGSSGLTLTLTAATSATLNTISTGAAARQDTLTAQISTTVTVTGTRIIDVAATGVSFAASVQTIFSGNCISCHAGAGAPQGLRLTTGVALGDIVDHAAGEVPSLKRVRPFRPDSSYLVHKVQGTQATVGGLGSQMPLGQAALPNATINIIRNWILQGALNN